MTKRVLSDKWVEAVIEYGYNPRIVQDSSVTIRKLARELMQVRAAIREAGEDVPVARNHLPWWNKLIHATLPEEGKR